MPRGKSNKPRKQNFVAKLKHERIQKRKEIKSQLRAVESELRALGGHKTYKSWNKKDLPK